jgi:hypothetical protein
MSPDSREQFRYRIIPNRREAVRLAVIGGEYQDEDGPAWTECKVINKALKLAEWHRNVFITIETRCNVIGLVRIEPAGSSYWQHHEGPMERVAAMSRLLVPLARDAHRRFAERQLGL